MMRFIPRKLTGRQIVSLGCILLGIVITVYALVQIEASSGVTTTIEPESIAAAPVSNRITSKASIDFNEAAQEAEPSPDPEEEAILYPIRPKPGDNIGTLTIPVLHQVIPIIEGADEDELKKGIGHFAQSVLPGELNNSVLSGHRDTVFRRLGELKVGDKLITETAAGSFIYIIKDIKIVDKADKTIIVPSDHAVLTVTTCYPFRYIGDAPNRYIITADLNDSEAEKLTYLENPGK